jgi:disulfide bond formation protein DsbB
MSVAAVSTFLALLALAAAFGVLVTLTFMALDRIGLVPGVTDGIRSAVRPIALWLAFAVALTAMLGSLYFSEVAGFIPCVLCWYQRIAMYPLVVILGVAAWRGDPRVAWYAGPVAAIGAALSVWHIAVQRIPGVPSGACSLETPCNLIYVERFGFVTIPTMALFGFLAILTLLFVYAGRSGPEPDADTDTELEPAS